MVLRVYGNLGSSKGERGKGRTIHPSLTEAPRIPKPEPLILGLLLTGSGAALSQSNTTPIPPVFSETNATIR